MRLRELAARRPEVELIAPRGASEADPAIDRVAHRSDAVTPGTLFCCLPGARADGHDFAPDAVARGAAALLVERRLELPVPQLRVPAARPEMGILADLLLGQPSHRLTVVGITGTNGKTTSSYLMRSVLEARGAGCGLIGTIGAVVGGEPDPIGHTTPESVDVHALMAKMLDAGDRACAMEVSSHALVQSRVAGVDFDVAIFTNLTRDHLDYHRDVEDYFAAKRRLFRRPAGEGRDPAAVANVDDPHGARLATETGALTVAVEREADVTVEEARRSHGRTELRASTPRGEIEIDSALRGRFNLANIAGVSGAAEVLGLPHEQVRDGIAAVPGVPGRFESIDAGQGFEVIVDYAHTPDSLENVLVAARGLAGGDGDLIVVFGCGGDRDAGKRPMMGAAAGALADLAIVTSDNPRSEDPEAIIADVTAGMADVAARVDVEPDRAAAIAAAIAAAGPGDVVVIAGKGHEQGQEVNGVVSPFDDRVVARRTLEGRGVGA